MASPVTTVTIAGITGKLATLIAKHLLQTPSVHINGLCRTPSKLPPFLITNPRVTIYEATATDVDKIRLALHGSSIAICCYLGPPTLMIDGQKALIDACIEVKVPRYMASDWCLDYRKLKIGDLPAKDPMILISQYLEERKNRISGVHVLNACFLEAPWRSIWDAETKGFKYWGTGEERWELTSYGNAAEFTALVALDADAVGFKSFRGDHISVKGIAAVFKEVYGKEPQIRRLGSFEDLYRMMHKVKEQNPGNMWAWLGMFYTYYSAENPLTTLSQPLDNDHYPGVKLITVRDYLKKSPIEALGKCLLYEDEA